MRVADRLIAAIVAVLVVVGAMWVLLVSPERSQVAAVSTQIDAQRTALATAQAQVANARTAAIAYVGHLRQIDAVLRAVPPVPGEAALIATIDRLAGTKVDFREFDLGAASATAGGPMSLGLTFTYWTTYQGLQSFLTALDGLTTTDGSNVSANGRLFTVTSVSMTSLSDPTLAPPNVTKATVSALAYLQGTPAAASGATGAIGATGTTGATGAPAVTG
jgi:hypothetical protein